MKKPDLLALLVPAILLSINAGLSGCSSQAEESTEAESAVEALEMVVTVAEVHQQDIDVALNLTGYVRAQTIVPVGGAIPGQVLEVKVKEGDPVKKGDVLITLDRRTAELQLQQADTAIAQATKQIETMEAATDLERKSLEISLKQAQAAVDQVKANLDKVNAGALPEEKRQVSAAVEAARAQVDSMQREVQRLTALYDSKVIPKSQLDKVVDGYRLASAQYNAAMAQLTLVRRGARDEDKAAVEAALAQVEAVFELAQVSLKRADIRRLEIEVAKTGLEQAHLAKKLALRGMEELEVRAPSDGVIQKRMVENGATIGPGVPLFYLVPTTSVAVEVYVTDIEKGAITPEAKGEYTIDALGKGATGKVMFISETVDPMRGGYLVRIEIPQELSSSARDGMFTRVKMLTGTRKTSAVVIPAISILHREGKRVAFVEEEGKAVLKQVSVGLRQGDLVEITQGISAGQKVITEGHLNLLDGAPVRLHD